MIKKAFDELAINEKFFEKFKEEVERLYSELQKDSLNNDNYSEEENYADSIRFSKNFMEYYVPEKEKGHCDVWAETYANSRLAKMVEFDSYREAYYAVKDVEERKKELNIHVTSVSEDPLFRERYKYLFAETEDDPKKYAESYCNDYRSMVALGKSEIFAHAYADYYDGSNEKLRTIYAQAYELVKSHGMDDCDANNFGETCVNAVFQGIWLHTDEFLKQHQEDWLKEFYFTLIKQDFEVRKHRKMSSAEEEKYMKEIFD